MTTFFRALALVIILIGSGIATANTVQPLTPETQFNSHGFHSVRLYKPTMNPARLKQSMILFLAPRWLENESFDVSKRLAREGHWVVWIDPENFKLPFAAKSKRSCGNFTDCLVGLSAFIQKRETFGEVVMPALLTIEETARFAESIWHEAPEDSFSAILSVDYCPKATGSPTLLANSPTRWTILESPRGKKDCATMTTAFSSLINVERAFLNTSPRIRSGPMIRWVSQRLGQMRNVDNRKPANVASDQIKAPDSSDYSIEDLMPMVIDPDLKGSYESFVVLYSGDGGWAEFTDELAIELKELKIPVVGINSMRYFWKAKRPEKGAADLERLVRHYMKKWSAKKVHLIGFSFGAGTLPFFLSRLPQNLKKNIGTVALLSPYRKADFEFFLSDWLFGEDRGVEVMPELKHLGLSHAPVCVFSAIERDQSLCTVDSKVFLRAVELPGGHHFNGSIKRVVKAVFP